MTNIFTTDEHIINLDKYEFKILLTLDLLYKIEKEFTSCLKLLRKIEQQEIGLTEIIDLTQIILEITKDAPNKEQTSQLLIKQGVASILPDLIQILGHYVAGQQVISNMVGEDVMKDPSKKSSKKKRKKSS